LISSAAAASAGTAAAHRMRTKTHHQTRAGGSPILSTTAWTYLGASGRAGNQTLKGTQETTTPRAATPAKHRRKTSWKAHLKIQSQ